jgi:polynucleotide 5'-hydroxyl-kinase GRC3/NOL9
MMSAWTSGTLCKEQTVENLENWARRTADDLLARSIVGPGICLFLGAADMGKTSLAAALADRLSCRAPVAFVDADVGQSHIGPPAAVGCAILDKPCPDLTAIVPEAIAFVGDVSPVGHLLQFAAALARCLAAVGTKADITLIDTPGLVSGGAAAALWWTVHRIVRPAGIIALERQNELETVLAGLDRFDAHIERIHTPAALGVKTPEQRRQYRMRRFADYFRQATRQPLNLAEVAIQSGRNIDCGGCVNLLVALMDKANAEIALGLIKTWDADKKRATVLTPTTDLAKVRCIVVGDLTIEEQ